MPMSESVLQMQLSRDPIFLQRLQYLMLQQARVVKAEAQSTAFHAQRSQYATSVLNNAMMATQQASGTIVGGPNLIGTVDITDNGIVTTAADAAILSQVATYWDTLAGVDSGAQAAAAAAAAAMPPVVQG
jgi:hypothetical protein